MWLKTLPTEIQRVILKDMQLVLLKGQKLPIPERVQWAHEPIPCYNMWIDIFPDAKKAAVKRQFYLMRHFFRYAKRFWLVGTKQNKNTEMVLYEIFQDDLFSYEDNNYLRGMIDGILSLSGYQPSYSNIQIRNIYSTEHEKRVIQIFLFGEYYMNNIYNLVEKSTELQMKDASFDAKEHCVACPYYKLGVGSVLKKDGLETCKCPKLYKLVMWSRVFKERRFYRRQTKKKTIETYLEALPSRWYKKAEFELF